MTKHDKADQARKGLIDSVKGKAKEISGAVTGNDSLTAEGQLEQTQAQQRKDANSVEAVADAQRAVQRAKSEERDEVGAAAEEIVDATDEHQTSVRQAASARAEADRIRRQADSLTKQANLP